MNKNKSKAAYTNKWLNRNKRFWHEAPMKGNSNTVIVIDKKDAPKIVIERVKQINKKRGCMGAYMVNDDPVDRLVNCLQNVVEKKKFNHKRKLKKLSGGIEVEVSKADLTNIFKDED